MLPQAGGEAGGGGMGGSGRGFRSSISGLNKEMQGLLAQLEAEGHIIVNPISHPPSTCSPTLRPQSGTFLTPPASGTSMTSPAAEELQQGVTRPGTHVASAVQASVNGSGGGVDGGGEAEEARLEGWLPPPAAPEVSKAIHAPRLQRSAPPPIFSQVCAQGTVTHRAGFMAYG